MKITQLVDYSKKLLEGRRMRALLVAFGFVGTFMFFRLAEIAAASIMLYCTDITPSQLFSSNNAVWHIFAAICTLLKYILGAPMMTSAALRFTRFCGAEVGTKISMPLGVFSDKKLALKSIVVFLCMKAVSFAFILPVGFFGLLTVKFLQDGAEANELFYSVHCISMTILSFFVWIWSLLGMTAVPFVIIRAKEKNPIKIIITSFKIMRNRRNGIVRLCFLYIPSMLLIVTIPFLLAQFFMAISLYINISIKEEEYLERASLCCGSKRAYHASKLFDWKKRRFKKASDKT